MNQFKHANWWRSYLGELSKDFGWLQAWISSGNTSTSKEKQSGKANNGEEENRGQQLQSSFALLEHLPKSIFYMLYTISKLRKSIIQRLKPCTIWSSNEEDMAFGSQLLQACAKISHNTFKIRTAHAWCEFCSAFTDSTLDIFLCIFWCNFLSWWKTPLFIGEDRELEFQIPQF